MHACYTDNDLSRDEIAEYLQDAFSLAKNNFPWLDTIYWYRLTDRDLVYQGSKVSKMDGFGVVESPETWTWKPAAYAYQSIAHLDDSAAGISIPYIGLAVLLATIVIPEVHARIYERLGRQKTVQKTAVEKVKQKLFRRPISLRRKI